MKTYTTYAILFREELVPSSTQKWTWHRESTVINTAKLFRRLISDSLTISRDPWAFILQLSSFTLSHVCFSRTSYHPIRIRANYPHLQLMRRDRPRWFTSHKLRAVIVRRRLISDSLTISRDPWAFIFQLSSFTLSHVCFSRTSYHPIRIRAN